MSYEGSALPPKPLMVNREAEREALEQLWAAATTDKPLLVAILGKRGHGKSVLMTTLAYHLADHFEKVVHFGALDGGPRTVLTAADLAAHLLCQLDVGWQDLPPPELRTTVLRSLIGRSKVLIVLDDIDSVSQVLPLLGNLSQAAVLVAGPGEPRDWKAAHFTPFWLSEFTDKDGVELIRLIAGPAVESVDQLLLRRLVTVVGGVPEWITLVASQLAVGNRSAVDYAQWLEQAAVEELAAEFREGDMSVYNAICEWGYQGLSADEARAYERLGAISLSVFDSAVASAALELPRQQVEALLRRLVSRMPIRALTGGFYTVPVVVQKHALAKLAQHDPTGTTRNRVLSLTIHCCVIRVAALAKSVSPRPIPATGPGTVYDTIEPAYRGEDQAEQASAELAAGWPMYTDAGRVATREGMEVEAVLLWISLWPFGYQTVRTTELIDGYSELLAIAESTQTHWAIFDDAGTRFQILRDLGCLYERIGETEQAHDYFLRAADIGYLPGTASALEWLAITLEAKGRLREALTKLAEAWAAVHLMSDPKRERRAYALLRMHRGRVLFALGRFSEAARELHAAVEYFRTRPTDRNNAARCWILLGDIVIRDDGRTEAKLRWEEALEVLTGYAMSFNAAEVHDKLAALADEEQRPADARAHRDQARELRFAD